MAAFNSPLTDPSAINGTPAAVTAEPRRSVRAKLQHLALVVTAVSVCLAGGAMVIYDLSVYRGSWTSDLASQASILGVSVAPALEFDDHELAMRNLTAMRVRPGVLVAALYTADGRLYASYSRDPQSTPPPGAPAPARTVVGEHVELSSPIVRNGEQVGTLFLRARYDVHSRIEAYTGIFLLIMALSLVVSYVLSRRLQKAITDPLDAMTAAAREVVLRRDYSVRAARTTDDEIGIAVSAFNGMLNEVEARVRVSEAANAALQTEVAVRLAAEAALREEDRRKDEFLATLAHELRNPLAPIRHAVRLLEADAANAQQQQWGRAVIGRQVQRMALLLDDLLDVSRITRGLLHLKLEIVALSSVIQDALEVARPLIEERRHQFSLTLPDEGLTLLCDPLRLSQSLSNLLTNAAKYTDDGGRISLTVALGEAELTLSVKDSGIGIDPKAIPGLFKIFSQLDSAMDRAEGGLGIGLALVEGLVALHGGRVAVTSAGIGMGSEFTIRLPRSTVVVLPQDVPPADASTHGSDHPQQKLLIADDNRDACDSMSMVLEILGYTVLTAYSGKDAVSMAQQHRPDVALLDIGMPDMNGYEVAREIRRSDWGRAIYLVAITGWGQTEDKTRARAAGFDQHMTKPVDPDQVHRMLCEHARPDTAA